MEHVPSEERAGGKRLGKLAADQLGKIGGGNAGAGALDRQVFFAEQVAGIQSAAQDERLAADFADILLDRQDPAAGRAAKTVGLANEADVLPELLRIEAGG